MTDLHSINNLTPRPALDEVRAKMHATAVEAALRIIGSQRRDDATALADLVVAHWEQVCLASVELLNLGDVPVSRFGDEIAKRIGALVTASTVNVSVIAIEALGIAVHGSAHTKQ
jgi:hypothetical protein